MIELLTAIFTLVEHITLAASRTGLAIWGPSSGKGAARGFSRRARRVRKLRKQREEEREYIARGRKTQYGTG